LVTLIFSWIFELNKNETEQMATCRGPHVVGRSSGKQRLLILAKALVNVFIMFIRWMLLATHAPAAFASRAASARSGHPILVSEARIRSLPLAAAASTDQICNKLCITGCGLPVSTLQWSIPPRCTARLAADRALLRTF
jgi:hypothetical protein